MEAGLDCYGHPANKYDDCNFYKSKIAKQKRKNAVNTTDSSNTTNTTKPNAKTTENTNKSSGKQTNSNNGRAANTTAQSGSSWSSIVSKQPTDANKALLALGKIFGDILPKLNKIGEVLSNIT